MVRSCRTTSCASPAKRPCSSTSPAKFRTCTAASASRSTTSTSRSSSRGCCARCGSRRPGDTNLLPGSVMDKFDFRQANDAIMQCLKITEKGDSEFAVGSIVPKDVLEQANAQIEALGGDDRQGHEAEAGDRRHAALGHHQGVGAKLQLHLGRQLPGNDQGAHRSGAGRPDRPPRRPQGKRDPRPLDSGRHRLPHDSRSGSPHSARGARSAGGREGAACSNVRSRCWNRRWRATAAMATATRRRRPHRSRRPRAASTRCWAARLGGPSFDDDEIDGDLDGDSEIDSAGNVEASEPESNDLPPLD